MLKRSTETF